MSHPFASREQLVFAHRGGAKLAPENTLAAFANGMALGADGFECDVHLSRDGVPVVIHDATLDRTTDAIGPVASLTADELARVDAGFQFRADDGSFPFRGRGIGVPTLEQVLGAHRHARAIVEMKGSTAALARAVVALIERHDAVPRVCVGSFHPEGLGIVRAEAPHIATSASVAETRSTLYRSWCRWPFRGSKPYYAFQVPEHAGRVRVVSRAFLRQAHRVGARVDVWVVDDPADIERLFDWGVDGVITDRPDVALRARASVTQITQISQM